MSAPVSISHLDHLVLTVRDISVSCDFYNRALGMARIDFAGGRVALAFGNQKINLHPAGNEYDPKAQTPVPGSGDLCFITETPIDAVITHLSSEGIEIIEGPAPKTGAIGPILSVYFRDPDGNLIEVSNYT
ncbi:MAG: VOC family protein [Rhodospirillaceae bacterium]|jgi:catechol 2,3-dioxygenase-like lactoylglutathione lyase family enzyme|nr:VOC family protein [Rhodospirillaceae bacterium]